MKHEKKPCPRCGTAFECKVGDVGNCQCSGITLSAEEKKLIAERYDDCLCRKCLDELRNKYEFFREEMFWK